ncbi:hypothetical protein WK91_18390 [Burkholderia cepacia]|uniref:hypothetical protein n=1 Tax=Burkholderia cepacia TaxID=292 RepID=UPI000759C35E|nr:hypothetical protein [Burkholderia cepacia]KVW15406.1 hypothetical protein WK91_18390 [Burkholderia cepacia]
MIDLDQLEALAKAAPSGQWEVWTSNSWRRVLSRQDGGNARVIEPTVQRHDNHPDLMFGEGVREYLEGVTPDVVLALIAEARALRGKTIGACVEAVANLAGEEYSPIWNSAISDAVDRLNAMKAPK